jgi:uncharacterized protein (DUF427 family)
MLPRCSDIPPGAPAAVPGSSLFAAPRSGGGNGERRSEVPSDVPSATLNGVVIAEAPESDVLRIEGNVYFPPSAVRHDLLTTSPTPYMCPWKGACQYFTVDADGQRLPDRAWTYPTLYSSAIDRVGADFSNYVAFWKEVRVS